ncbi:MAG: hypothetical protein AAGC68_05075, partial [Verrucomicrobiota bacterium]
MKRLRFFFLAVVLSTSASGNAQYRNYSLRCLAPLLSSVDPNAPKTIQEAFLSGPTNLAKPLQGVGAEAIEFPVSTGNEEAQQYFDQGLALLHVLSYKDAERAFRTVVELDPEAPMGYWGLAQANERRPAVAKLFAEAARDRCDRNRPELEQRWTSILANFYAEESNRALTQRSLERIQALEDLALEFPDHAEVRAFLLRRLTLDQFLAGLPTTSTLTVDTYAQDFAEEFPEHPSRHYRVFLWLRRHPERVVASVPEMVNLTPRAAEVWRYGSEAFSAAGHSSEAIRYARTAITTDLLNLEEQERMPWQAENLYENQAYLVDLLAKSGRVEEALVEADKAIALPHSLSGSAPPDESLRVDPLLISGQWERLLGELESHPSLTASTTPIATARRLLWQTLASCALGDDGGAKARIEDLSRYQRDSLIAGVTNEEEKSIEKTLRTAKRIRSLFLSHSDDVPPSHFLLGTDLPVLAKAHLLSLSNHPGPAYEIVAEAIAEKSYRWLPTALSCHFAMEAGRTREALFPFDRRFRSDAA